MTRQLSVASQALLILLCTFVVGFGTVGPDLFAAEDSEELSPVVTLSQSVRRAAVIEAVNVKLRAAGVEPLPGEEKYNLPINASHADKGWRPGGPSAMNAIIVGTIPVAEEGNGEAAPYIGIGTRFGAAGCEDSMTLPLLGEPQAEDEAGIDPCIAGIEALVSAAERLAAMELAQPVLVAAWRGEVDLERWLPMDRLSAFINLEQVGRLSEDRLVVRGAHSSAAWPKLIEQSNVVVGFDVNTEKYMPTDAVVFYKAGVPTLELSGGQGERMPHLAQEDLDRVAQLAYLLVRKLEQGTAQPELSSDAEEGREVQRAFTGTVPDYTADVEGLRLEGVIEGGPADLAGFQEGDVIIRFGERAIQNIHDYSDALADAKPGVPIEVVLLRDGTEYVASLTPTTRE